MLGIWSFILSILKINDVFLSRGVTYPHSILRLFWLLFEKTDGMGVRMEVERLLKVRNYVAWTGKECENGEQLINVYV